MASTKEEQASDVEVEVKVDGLPLGMVPFVARIVGGTVLGLITTLKGAENAREIEIRVRRRG